MEKKIKHYVILFNGLGNQIGQLALYYFLRDELQLDIDLINVKNRPDQANIYSLLPVTGSFTKQNKIIEYVFRLSVSPKVPRYFKKCLKYLTNIKIYQEPLSLRFDTSEIQTLTKNNSVIFVGGWHSSKLHDRSLPKIQSLFPKKYAERERIVSNENYLNGPEKQTLGIHIRGKDYNVGNERNIYGNIATKEYYLKAIKLAQTKIPGAKIKVFTDDIDYVNTMLLETDFIFSDENDAIKDFHEMNLCDALIIGNSSFSYWAARLNNDLKFIICPCRLTNFSKEQTYPDSWIGLNNE